VLVTVSITKKFTTVGAVASGIVCKHIRNRKYILAGLANLGSMGIK
jgi:hypothetical protein